MKPHQAEQFDILTWAARAARACGRDITANRHKGNAESVAAFERARLHMSEGRMRVLQAIRNAPAGLTCKELAEQWEVGMNAVSGRFSELKSAGLIRPSGARREGGAVMVATINEGGKR